jgi:hypothetical protein
MKERIQRAFENIKDLFKYLTGSPDVDFDPGSQAERKNVLARIITIIFIIVLITIILILLIPWIRYYNSIVDSKDIKADSWLGFIGAFGGAIIGAIIACIGTIVTTWQIIRNSHKDDFHRERMTVLPILEVIERTDLYKKYANCSKEKERIGFLQNNGIWYNPYALDEKNYSIFEIRNIGQGIAITVSTVSMKKENGEPTPEFVHLSKDCSGLFLEEYNDKYDTLFRFGFYDIYDNYYEQDMTFRYEKQRGLYLVKTKMPVLIRKTPRIRYVQ